MNLPRFLRRMPLKRGLDLTILAMGLFTLALILATGEAYRYLAIDSARGTLSTVAEEEAGIVLRDLAEQSRELGLDIQARPEIRAALSAGRTDHVRNALEDQFNRYFVTAGIIKLEAIWLLDRNLNPVSVATRKRLPVRDTPRCDNLLARAALRKGHDRLRPLSGMCLYGDRAMFAQLTPVGLKPAGYVVVVSDPAHNLLTLEQRLQRPVILLSAGGEPLYRSDDWKSEGNPRAVLEADYRLTTAEGRPALTVRIQGDFLPFYQRLMRLQNLILALAVAGILLTMLAARFITRKMVLDPLQDLSRQLRHGEAGRRIADRSPDSLVAFHEFAELQELYAALQDMALTDSLTHLPNRLHFERQLRQLVEQARGDGQAHALCYIDLDQFKVVNDSCGHAAGDLLLQQLAGLLREHIRSIDLLARIGGDEFALLLENCSSGDATRIANQVRTLVQEFRFFWRDQCFSVGASIGVVPIDAGSGDPSRVLSLADAACYVAKQKGRNHVHLYSANDVRIEEHDSDIEWATRLQRALDEDLFELVCQPVRGCARSRSRLEFLEVLVWLRDSRGKLLRPVHFMAPAERYGLMPEIDRWVVDRALQEIGRLSADRSRVGYSINLSGHSLSDDSFLHFVIDRLDRSQVSPDRLCFEITESAAAVNFSKTTKFISTLRGMGCRFVLDDFGTGLSSFTYLQSLGIDYIKIDGRLVHKIMESEVDRRMLEAVVQIGRSLHIATIAEAVETERCFRELQGIGIDYAQGYYLGKPQSLELNVAGVVPLRAESAQ